MSSLAEHQIAKSVADELKAEGYDVVLQPSPEMLPRFLKGKYTPDLVAFGDKGNVAIEIARRSSFKNEKLEGVAQFFREDPNWTFRVHWLDDEPEEKPIPQSTHKAIEEQLQEVRRLIESRYTGAAFLLLWASLEAIARLEMPKLFPKPQSPGRVVRILTSKGYLTPSEADRLDHYIQKRNALIHGNLGTEIDRKDAIDLLTIAEAMLPKKAA